MAGRFGLADMLREDQDTAFNLSRLYYLGVLALGGRTLGGNRFRADPSAVGVIEAGFC